MRGSIRIRCYHGWGFGPSLWTNFEQEFHGKIRDNVRLRHHTFHFDFADRGYFGGSLSRDLMSGSNSGATHDEAAGKPETPDICLVHSQGLHHFADEMTGGGRRPDLLVILGGFFWFHDVDQRRSERVLNRMIHAFDADPGTVLRSFYANVSYPGVLPQQLLDAIPGNESGLTRLKSDLAALDARRLAPQFLQEIPRIIAIHGAKDRIVPSDHLRLLQMECKQALTVLLPEAGHGLPCQKASEICDFLISRLESMYLSG